MSASARLTVSYGLLLAALLLFHLRSTGEAVPPRKSLDAFPMALGEWRGGQESVLAADILNVLKVNDYVIRRYEDGAGHSLWLYIGYWASQRKGADIHSPKNCLPGGGWEPLEASRLTIQLPAPYAPVVVNRYVIQKERTLQVVLYWYQSHGKAIAGEVGAKLEMVRSAVLRNRTDGALVRVSGLVLDEDPDRTTERLVRYVQDLYPVLKEYLPE